MHRMLLSSLLLSMTCVAAARAATHELVDYIDPMIGAITLGGYGGHGLGKTFPGAATPFGLVQLSPDTITGGDNGCGYSAHHTTIEGFSLTHLTGVGWYGDLGNFQIMPSTGPRQLDREQVKSEYSHEEEGASAGYYWVNLKRYGIKVELTAAPHAGILRMTFPESQQSRIQIDLGRRIGQKERWLSHSEQQVRKVDDHTIEGYMLCSSKDGGWGHGAGNVSFQQFFTARFNIPLTQVGIWDKDQLRSETTAYTGTNTGWFVEFATTNQQQVLMAVGVSYVSQEGARANVTTEIPDLNFAATHQRARARWQQALTDVHVSGGSDAEKTIFATALYHCFIDPRSTSDVTGHYRGADNQIRQSTNFVYRTIFSGWDVFRSQFPLLTLLRPDVVNDEVNSLIELATRSTRKYFPRWEILNAYSGCMIGNPAVSVLTDAYTKGIRNYPIDLAFTYARNTVERNSNGDRGFTPGNLSMTLEHAYSDWCMAWLAEQLGKSDDAKKYYARSLAYTNVWDDAPDVRWMRARVVSTNQAPAWLEPWKGKTTHGQGCVESNPYQQGWFVPHDVEGMVALMGPEYAEQELIAFFEKAPADLLWNDYYNHPNEPCHHIAFLFNPLGKPWLTQKWTRHICATAYTTGVRGLCGNEDVGQMSAWYVLAAMGLHPICPGDGIYQITSPVFEEITLTLNATYYSGEKFRIRARNNSPKNSYIQSAMLNGQPLHRAWLTHHEIVAGGTLDLLMGDTPATEWFTELPPNPFQR